jgi:hypothetical protein
MRDGVCRLQLLLALARAFILGSEFRGSHDHILLSQIRDSPNLEGQVPVFVSPGNKVAQLYPRHWVPFSPPPTTCRATVEVFEPSSTRDTTRCFELSCLQHLGTGHVKNAVSIVIVRQYIATAALVTAYSIRDEMKGYKTPVVIG